jgi:hypothetical protein
METAKLEINIHQLENEASSQSRHFGDAGVAFADAEYNHRNARLERDQVCAKVEIDVRKNPSKYKLDKVTDKSVEAALALSNEVKEAENKLAEAEKASNLAKAYRDAWAQRGSLIRAEVDLWMSNYFSTNSAEGEIVETERQVRGKKVR